MSSRSERGRHLDPETLGEHLDRLYRAAWGLCGSREEAEDLVQDTYARVLAKPRFLRRDDDLGYLLRVLHNTFVSGLRSTSRRPRTVELVEERPDPRSEAGDLHVESRDLLAVVAGLAAEYRDVLAAVDLAGLSYKEAGKALGIPEGTVMSRLFRARQRVMAAMNPQPAVPLE
ncbi:MAG: RNA polymerase sigma factor [Thermoleophilaceae bacterium]